MNDETKEDLPDATNTTSGGITKLMNVINNDSIPHVTKGNLLNEMLKKYKKNIQIELNNNLQRESSMLNNNAITPYTLYNDSFYKMIIKYKMRGMATKKNEVIGTFMLGGYSQRITMIEHIIEESRIRIKNKQNIVYVYILSFLRIIKNFHQLGLSKFIK